MNPRHFWLLALAGLFLVLGLLAVRGCRQKPEAVVVPDTVDNVAQERPQAPKTPIQKIIKHTVRPQLAVSRETPDTFMVRRFAAAVRTADSLRRENDSLRILAMAGDALAALSIKPLPAILPTLSGNYDGTTFKLWMTRSDGSILRATAKLKPNFGFAAGVDAQTEKQPAFYEDRAWVRTIRQMKKCAVPAGAGTLAGAVFNSDDRALGAAIGGLAVLTGCLIG